MTKFLSGGVSVLLTRDVNSPPREGQRPVLLRSFCPPQKKGPQLIRTEAQENAPMALEAPPTYHRKNCDEPRP